MTVREAYEDSLHREGHDRDAAQEQIVALLADLQQRLQEEQPKRGVRQLLDHLFRPAQPAQTGLYIWGGVGRGKTFLMDLFYDTLAIEAGAYVGRAVITDLGS